MSIAQSGQQAAPGTATPADFFTSMSAKPADALLALIGAFRGDTRAGKIDVGVGVYRDREGRTPKFIYTIPTFHNPGGVTMALERRKRLVEIARERELLVLEDNP